MQQLEKKVGKSKNKRDRIIIALIALSVLLIIFSFIAPLIFTGKTTNPRYNFKETGAIGDTIGGLMNPFITLAGVFITFLAFYMQLKANQIQIDLFNRNQQEQTSLLKEEFFFRLIDNLNQKIINFSYSQKSEHDNNEYTNYKALDNLIGNILDKIDHRCISLGRHILAKFPEQIGEVQYLKILQGEITSASIENAELLKKAIVEQKDYNDRWEYIKLYVGSSNNTDYHKTNALKTIGNVLFYKIPFSEREDVYTSAYDEVYREFGGFMDGYTKNLAYLIDFIIKNEGNTFFVDYLKNNLSTQELIFIFYYCSSYKSNEKVRSQIKEINLLEGIIYARNKFIDVPSENELKNEIEYILARADITVG